MATQLYETFAGDQVTNTMLAEAATLFSKNYGTWDLSRAEKDNRSSSMRVGYVNKCLPDTAKCSYTRVTVDGNLAGHAFACRWECNGKTVCWVTQLVVDKDYRERGLASHLLRSLRAGTDDIYGIMSSHPAACVAATASFGTTIEKLSLDFVAEQAQEIMKRSPISYINEAILCGTLFDPIDSSDLVCGVNTGFFVDHEEPLEALSIVRDSWRWPLGDLPDGHEYLLVIPGKHRRQRSKSEVACFAGQQMS